MWVVSIINKFLKPIGVKLSRYPDLELARRIKLLRYFQINKVLDVGANIGSYGKLLKDLNYDGQIISFEPIPEVFKQLEKNIRKYEGWIALNYALGDSEQESFINVSNNFVSSSILEILPNHVQSSPNSKVIKQEKISIKKLDDIFSHYCLETDNVFLKIDTQGFEKQVLDGAEKSLKNIRGIQIEMSLVPLYNGSMLFPEMREYLCSKGFSLYSLENGFSDVSTGRLLQVDGIFFR